MPDMREFITAETTDNKYCVSAVEVKEPKTSLSQDNDELLKKVLPINGTSLWYVPVI